MIGIFLFYFRLFLMRVMDIPYLNLQGPDCKWIYFLCSCYHSDKFPGGGGVKISYHTFTRRTLAVFGLLAVYQRIKTSPFYLKLYGELTRTG